MGYAFTEAFVIIFHLSIGGGGGSGAGLTCGRDGRWFLLSICAGVSGGLLSICGGGGPESIVAHATQATSSHGSAIRHRSFRISGGGGGGCESVEDHAPKPTMQATKSHGSATRHQRPGVAQTMISPTIWRHRFVPNQEETACAAWCMVAAMSWFRSIMPLVFLAW